MKKNNSESKESDFNSISISRVQTMNNHLRPLQTDVRTMRRRTILNVDQMLPYNKVFIVIPCLTWFNDYKFVIFISLIYTYKLTIILTCLFYLFILQISNCPNKIIKIKNVFTSHLYIFQIKDIY